jgi:hypothetical protein
VQWRAFWASLHQALQATSSTTQVAPRTPDPVLIIGPWRSGSTAMHELLADQLDVVTPRTWQCMNPLTFRWLRGAPCGPTLERPMDGMPIGPLSPQEDEFALLGLGVPSAYQAFLMPSRIRELEFTLEHSYWREQRQWLQPWSRFLADVWLAADRPGADLLLKCPNHTFRIQAIIEAFPSTRVIWMTRPASELLVSNRKMWRSMFELHGRFDRGDPEGLEHFLHRALEISTRAQHWCADNLAPGCFIEVSQDDLRRSPETVVCKVIERLGLRRRPPLDAERSTTLPSTNAPPSVDIT